MTQMTHNNFFTMTEIGRITLPEPLSCLHSFITLKKYPYVIARHPFVLTLLLPSRFITICRYTRQHAIPHIPQSCIPNRHLNLFSLCKSPSTQLFQMINNTTSKYRDCSIQYK
ncbi:hypothetical protein PHYBLDRAFT_145094 [Phycomyces blakesleeanus NRRL 1555(-)]|uniref:Uncharacterized protein n=1 Tax=Phycomyces blakesleeanus (strain ATCC 8743b / DSM 1359 / FGSC 10004 / NBRC 33097 / NRRL 1555) TaxID=763407 RepID=A0A162PT14_PHYB8|nr:hypothetical protein PHYBLDRAFT_145094 [Phycomyces blakesleeanus NRRL 1555(-)]OAD73616.1 hypothetical protein PHYBLDRAFT_145094 [Phycomyces blakesleeanus NRRL 1555(-)]|eukprot:XP_018291656.1 hypothetical protein PHYBLDRAFT_145094 [Phycomyces blakesleeanus NRRL 1555(-)]